MLRRNTLKGLWWGRAGSSFYIDKVNCNLGSSQDAAGWSSSPEEPRSPQRRSLSLRRRAAALRQPCQAPRKTGVRRSIHPLQPPGCRIRCAARRALEPAEPMSRGFRGGQAGSAAGLCSSAIMQKQVVEDVVPWLARTRLRDFAILRCKAGYPCPSDPR